MSIEDERVRRATWTVDWCVPSSGINTSHPCEEIVWICRGQKVDAGLLWLRLSKITNTWDQWGCSLRRCQKDTGNNILSGQKLSVVAVAVNPERVCVEGCARLGVSNLKERGARRSPDFCFLEDLS